jgi:hypothetical protein
VTITVRDEHGKTSSKTLHFLVDTGATHSSLPSHYFWIDKRRPWFHKDVKYVTKGGVADTANGLRATQWISCNSMKVQVGAHSVDVTRLLLQESADAPLLLGCDVLLQLNGSWTVGPDKAVTLALSPRVDVTVPPPAAPLVPGPALAAGLRGLPPSALGARDLFGGIVRFVTTVSSGGAGAPPAAEKRGGAGGAAAGSGGAAGGAGAI